ncbi:MAG: tRNA (N6-threonylcarbamoyladenosine(37)-N6)-methyltransferase TrmO [Prolixibacteraceae bacterium]|nr:tRNA (N6-threonylcarbamoyladenosine(37)-N6)-methyltransferase TrmO [Prolixibacteraceae bacterium]
MNRLKIHPIGTIETPYSEAKKMPIQGRFDDGVVGCCHLFPKFEKGLAGLEKFSHAILIYQFHKTKTEEIEAKPFLENETHGIFAIRSPNRPNRIGMSIVKIKNIKNNNLFFTEVDMLDGSPLLDIKPFIKHFDSRKNVISGWLDKHFEDGNIPDKTILK